MRISKSALDLKRILIIEDEGDICLLLNIILKEDDTQINHVTNLAEAKTYLQADKPALIILDNKLPDGLGIDFLSYLKQNYADIKIMMVSGFGNAAKDLALANGADLFIDKPFTKQQISDAVKTLLQSEDAVV